jgi:hypothetical protein
MISMGTSMELLKQRPVTVVCAVLAAAAQVIQHGVPRRRCHGNSRFVVVLTAVVLGSRRRQGGGGERFPRRKLVLTDWGTLALLRTRILVVPVTGLRSGAVVARQWRRITLA